MRRLLASLLIALFAGGCGMPSLMVTPVVNTNELEEMQIQEGKGFSPSKVVIIEVEGMLVNAKSGGFLQPTENKLSLFTQQLEKAAKDDSVKAVVLRINSPGGTVTCSDTMYEQIKEFRATAHKPVISSTQEVCASGAYYLACGSDVIISSPTSIVGSIGVIFNTFDVSGAMAKLGIRSEALTSGPLKDMGSPFKPLDPQAKVVMQDMIDSYYARFLNVVTSNRKQLANSSNLKNTTDGRVFSGEQALAAGLVDRLGRLEDAVTLAKQMTNSPNAKVMMYKRPYGYSGSIYADSSIQSPRANVFMLELPESEVFLPRGFYYLWAP